MMACRLNDYETPLLLQKSEYFQRCSQENVPASRPTTEPQLFKTVASQACMAYVGLIWVEDMH